MLSFVDPKTRQTIDPSILSQDGFIFHLFSDNISSISWMKYPSRLRDPLVTRLTFALSALVYTFNNSHPSVLQPLHIPGKENDPADALSRPQIFPTYHNVIHAHPFLDTIPPIHLPSKLISLLKRIIYNTSTEESLEKEMI